MGSKVHRHDADLCSSNVERIWDILRGARFPVFCGKKRGLKFGIIQLLSVLAIGFGQGLYALDAADGSTDSPSMVNNRLIILALKAKMLFCSILGCQCSHSSSTSVRIY